MTKRHYMHIIITALPDGGAIWRHSSVGQSIRFIPEVSPVRIQVPLPKNPAGNSCGTYGPLVKWLRHGPFTAVTWVRVPYGSPQKINLAVYLRGLFGGLAQLVRAPASHAGGHWFESSSLHQKDAPQLQCVLFIVPTHTDSAPPSFAILQGCRHKPCVGSTLHGRAKVKK